MPGRHFLQIPGPTNVPDRVLRAIAQPTIDHRGPAFAALGARGARRASARVPDHRRRSSIYPVVRHRRVGSGARQHAVARRHGADVRDRPVRRRCGATWPSGSGSQVDFVPGDWRHGVDPDVVDEKLADDRGQHDQGRRGRPQRDVDRRDQPRRRRSGARSTRPDIRRCCWSTPSRRSARSTIATTSGASTSPSAARRKA